MCIYVFDTRVSLFFCLDPEENVERREKIEHVPDEVVEPKVVESFPRLSKENFHKLDDNVKDLIDEIVQERTKKIMKNKLQQHSRSNYNYTFICFVLLGLSFAGVYILAKLSGADSIKHRYH